MILLNHNETSPGVASTYAKSCRSSEPFLLIQNGTTSRFQIQPNGLTCSPKRQQQQAASSNLISKRHELGIHERPGGGSRGAPLIVVAEQAAARQCHVSNAQPSGKLVFSERRGKLSSRQPSIVIQLAKFAPFVCLATLVCLLHSHHNEVICRSIEIQKFELSENGYNKTSKELLHQTASTEASKSTNLADQSVSPFDHKSITAPTSVTETAGEAVKEEAEEEGDNEDKNGSSAGRDDDDAESCKGISADGSTKTSNLTDNERLVNLQSCFQRKVHRKLMEATRNGMEMFEKLSLSGGCSSSLMSLVGGLGQLKSFAFKFLDASAKVPSGMMYGLLSDYGDFDQCLSIRSNKQVSLEDEADEGAFSGKYCLMSLKLNYHIKLADNETVPEGIIEDGILWDDLVRHYWTSKISKGFQVGMCFPSRCTNDDLNQLYQHVAKSFNVVGEIISCQDSLDMKRQYEPDLLQRIILGGLYLLLSLTLIGTVVDWYWFQQVSTCASGCTNSLGNYELAVRVLLCFSIARNWTRFMSGYRSELSQQHKSNSYWSHPNRTLTSIGRFTPSSETRSIAERSSDVNRSSSASYDMVDYIDSDPEWYISASDDSRRPISAPNSNSNNSSKLAQPLTLQIDSSTCDRSSAYLSVSTGSRTGGDPLAHLSGLKLLIIIWITVGYSFLYPSANNYQYYRSIIRMNLTRDSVWFATTNFTLGIDMLLYITGLLFVYKLLARRAQQYADQQLPLTGKGPLIDPNEESGILSLVLTKTLRFWPTYLTLIGFAIVTPLISDGPMWPEMVSRKLGESCRNNWWANLLFINNYFNQSNICLPSSWFISILMQLLLIGSIIIVMIRRISLWAGLFILGSLLVLSALFSFCFAYLLDVRAPMIKMDESFVMDLDENIFRLYTNIFNNLGPFLIGMAGGLLLINHQAKLKSGRLEHNTGSGSAKSPAGQVKKAKQCLGRLWELLIGLTVVAIAILVLSSVFHEKYSKLCSAIYWSLHRIGWAIVTGYVIHNCATGRWKLLSDLLSLSAFAPLSRLIFIAYLVYPIFIHIHTGLVRDGLHISIYNMLNIYITRLVMTFMTALIMHLIVELPFRTIEELYLRTWINNKLDSCLVAKKRPELMKDPNRLHPLLSKAPECNIPSDETMGQTRGLQVNESSDKLSSATDLRQ